MKKRVRRFLITLIIMLAVCFRPIILDSPRMMSHRPGTYRIGEAIPEGKYVITPRDNGQFSSYQIATDYNMNLDNTKDAHWIDTTKTVLLEEGDYIRLINCTAEKEK